MIGYFVSRCNRPQSGIKQHSGGDECKGRHQKAKAWLFEELFSISQCWYRQLLGGVLWGFPQSVFIIQEAGYAVTEVRLILFVAASSPSPITVNYVKLQSYAVYCRE